jgi:hypothetical protein
MGSRLRYRMLRFIATSLLVLLGACEVFSDTAGRPKTTLSEREFIDVYVALAKAQTTDAKAQVLRQHGTTEKQVREFMQAYANDLPALSEIFDTIVARQGTQAETPDFPRLPR